MTLVITIAMDKKCKGCGKPGATQCGYCLKCVSRAMGEVAKQKGQARKDRKRRT